MLTGGPSVWWLKNLAEDKNNSLVFIGYQAEGSLGRRVQKGWKEVPMEQNGRNVAVPINMEIATVSGLSGHSDFKQLLNYLSSLKQRPERIIVDHGESVKVRGVREDLLQDIQVRDSGAEASRNYKIEIEINFSRKDKSLQLLSFCCLNYNILIRTRLCY